MKRHIWLSLGAGISAALIGCGDESNGGGDKGDSDAGGLVDYEDRLNDIDDQLDGIGGKLDELDGRLDELENPKVGSCSAGELCIPDGLDVVRSEFGGIVRALCKHEVDCCDPHELKYKFGAAIGSVDDCVATFNDFLKRGYSPSFLSQLQVAQIVEVAHALNNTDVHVALDRAALKACADSIGSVVCTHEPDGEQSLRCSPEAEPEDPCSARKLLKGQEREGDLCNLTGVVDECGEGLVCVLAKDGDGCWDEGGGYYYGSCEQRGICSKQPAPGDRCFDDLDCGKLFCNHATGTCQARAKVGEACEYVDPTFARLTPFAFLPYGNGQNTKIDCEEGAVCDPATKKCVSSCSQGAFCTRHADCPTGLVCSYTATADYGSSQRGQCVPPKTTGEACTSRNVSDFGPESDGSGNQNDCESGVCNLGACQAPRKAAGEACTTAGADATCQSGYCNPDLKCAATCQTACDGDDCASCPSGTYCDTGETVGGTTRVCKPLVATGSACDQTTADQHLSCASGYCDLVTTLTCQPKVAQNAACPSGYHEQCPDGQFCSNSGNCATPKAVGEPCAAGTDECGPDASCYDTKGQSAAGDYRCYTGVGDLPNGGPCNWDEHCASRWCRPEAPSGVGASACAERIEAGQPCDIEDRTLDTCVAGYYCAHDGESSAGTCKPLLTVGQPCNPLYEGSDCWGGNCIIVREAWVCHSNSLAPDTAFCDGK